MHNFISEHDIEQAILQHLQHMHGFNVLDYFTQDKEELRDDSKLEIMSSSGFPWFILNFNN